MYYFQQGTTALTEYEIEIPQPLTIPTHVDKSNPEEVKPFLNAVFYMARLYGKLQFQDQARTVAAWKKSLSILYLIIIASLCTY
jgi:hypothetical protein